jgi:hypothetical protein
MELTIYDLVPTMKWQQSSLLQKIFALRQSEVDIDV